MFLGADKDTSYSRKEKFAALLDTELRFCKHTIGISYEWKKTDQVLSLSVEDNSFVRLWININFGIESLFKTNEKAQELSMRYRAYYISGYIKCLDEVYLNSPRSYYSGLVSLCVINNINSNKKIISYSPIGKKKPSAFRPVDIHCAAKALIRLVNDYQDILSENEKNGCKEVINNFLTYSLLPEISYENKRPVYSLLYELKNYQMNIARGSKNEELFPMMMRKEGISLLNLQLCDFADELFHNHHPFWTEAAFRLILFYDRSFCVESEHAESLRECVNRFRENSVLYYKKLVNADSAMLKDNYMAVKRLSSRMDKAFSSVAAENGALHYFQ